MRQDLPYQVDGAPDIDVHDGIKASQIKWLPVPVDDLGGIAHACGGDDAANFCPGCFHPFQGATDGACDACAVGDIDAEGASAVVAELVDKILGA